MSIVKCCVVYCVSWLAKYLWWSGDERNRTIPQFQIHVNKRPRWNLLSGQHSPLWRKAPRRSWQQDGGERLSRVSVHSAYGRARESTDALGWNSDHAGVVGVVDVGVWAWWGVRGRSESGRVHELLMGWALTFAGWALLADVQGTLGSEGLWEGHTAIALVVVVDMVAEQPTRSLWNERREGKDNKEKSRK